jgi:hypothetical protein
MPPWGHLLIYPNGGHPGVNAAAVMRWTSPFNDKRLLITGDIQRDSPQGNGIRAMIVSSRTGVLKDVALKPKDKVSMKVEATVMEGDVLSFIVDAIDNNTNSDGYQWVPRIDLIRPDGGREQVTTADKDFCDATGWPFNRDKPQAPLSQLAQVLLMSNEFMFVD